MKRVISGIVLVAMLWMIAVPAAAARGYSLKAQFEWYLREGRLILDASCSKGRIEEYYWEIRENCEDVVESGYGRIYRIDCYDPGRYWVTLTVTDRQGREDEVTERVTIPSKYYREERIVISPRYLPERKEKRKICLTEEDRRLALKIIVLAFFFDFLKDILKDD